jgi:hypothetical protein
MNHAILPLLLILFACGCARDRAGLPDIETARQSAEAFMRYGDADAIITYTEGGALTDEEKKSFRDYANRWKGAKIRSHYERTETLTVPEFEEARKKYRKDWPAEMPYTPVRWSKQPEVVFVCYFEMRHEKEPTSGMYFIGAYRDSGLWYFAKKQ